MTMSETLSEMLAARRVDYLEGVIKTLQNHMTEVVEQLRHEAESMNSRKFTAQERNELVIKANFIESFVSGELRALQKYEDDYIRNTLDKAFGVVDTKQPSE